MSIRAKVPTVAIGALLLGLLAGVQPVTAKPVGCLPNIGKDLPVLFVHGFNENSGIWGKPDNPGSFIGQVNKLEGVSSELFDYEPVNRRWVDDKEIGPKLAKDIACRAESSRTAGGPGRVVVVTHSMGGLATRFAAAQAINGRKVSDDLGLVVTLGTPNEGTSLADWGASALLSACNPTSLPVTSIGVPRGSNSFCEGAVSAMQVRPQELKGLPRLPDNVPVLAIAGGVDARLSFFDIVVFEVADTDLVVGVKSALHGTNHVDKGAGEVTIGCTGRNALVGFSDAPCWHNALPTNPTVQKLVSQNIQKYLKPTAKSACLSGKEFEKTLSQLAPHRKNEDYAGYRTNGTVTCQNGWAAAPVLALYVGGYTPTPGVEVLRLVGGRWTYPPGNLQSICKQTPPLIRKALNCK